MDLFAPGSQYWGLYKQFTSNLHPLDDYYCKHDTHCILHDVQLLQSYLRTRQSKGMRVDLCLKSGPRSHYLRYLRFASTIAVENTLQ